MTQRRKDKRGGKQGDDLGQRVPLGLRVTPELKERLDNAAKETGRSQSQEAELRLERTFREGDLLPELMAATFGAKLAALLMVVGDAMSAVGPTVAHIDTQTPEGAEDWLNNPVAFDQAVKAARTVLDAMAPAGQTTPRSPKVSIAEGYARFYLNIASGQQSMTGARGRWGNAVQVMLGNDLVDRIRQRSAK
jgi:hypothetical protein